MSKILIVDATGRTEKQSKTKYLSEQLFNKVDLSKDEVCTLNLYGMNLPYVDQEILDSRISNKYETENQIEANKIVEQFENSDIIVFVYPVWNWSIPAVLKSYIDLIMISKRNFTYKGFKIVGLLENKKSLFINTSGGPLYSKNLSKIFDLDNPNLYMRKMMNTLGIKDTLTVAVGSVSYKFKNKETNVNFDFNLYSTHVESILNKRSEQLNNFFKK